MLHRSELVSQWQERLASAEHLAGATSQFRWFHTARIRLYRFLLSCYGGGQWRVDAEEDDGHVSSGVVALDDELSSHSGKPPKSAGKIQAVLKAVHNAQDCEPKAGPYVDGLDPTVYMAVTASDARIDVEKCERFLLDRGFHPRVVGRGRRLTVEVSYDELRQAQALVDIHRQRLRPVLKTQADKLRENPLFPEETRVIVIGLAIIAPLVGLCAATVGMLLVENQLGEWSMVGLFLRAFAVVAVVCAVWHFFGPRLLPNLTLTSRRRIGRCVFWTCVAVPTALFACAAIVTYQSNPQMQSLLSSPAVLLGAFLTLVSLVCLGFDWQLRR